VTTIEGSKVHTATITKQRDLDSRGDKLSCRFVQIELGENPWDEPVTACIVEEIVPESPHVAAVIERNERDRVEGIVVAAFKRLREMGLAPTDARNAQGYLPRQALEKKPRTGLRTRKASPTP
jgi:hypothetical protein